MVEEVMKNKKSFNSRARDLLQGGYVETGETKNSKRFRKKSSTIVLIQGWKSSQEERGKDGERR